VKSGWPETPALLDWRTFREKRGPPFLKLFRRRLPSGALAPPFSQTQDFVA